MQCLKTSFLVTVLISSVVAQDLLVSPWEKEAPETSLDMRMIEQAARDVAQNAVACTVALQIGNNVHGSGVIVSEDGLVLTAAHVVGRPNRDAVVRLPDGRVFRAKTLGIHTKADGGMLKILEPKDLPFATLVPENRQPASGDWCLATGHPSGFDLTRTPPVRLGRIIDVRRHILRSDCPVTGGDSGGPLFDLRGRVIGIHSRISENLTDNFHVPLSSYREAWSQMAAGEIYPTAPPSQFLAILDKNKDGKLTRDELSNDFERNVFDRVAKNFDLDLDRPLEIENVTKVAFNWKAADRLSQLEFPRGLSIDALSQSNYVRGQRIGGLVHNTIADAAKATVRIYSSSDVATRQRRVALGALLDKSGLIVTKASLLKDHTVCELHDGRKFEAKVLGEDKKYDVALLKVEADDLPEPVWEESSIAIGSWLFTPDQSGDTRTVGVVSVLPREIPRINPVLGITVYPNVVSHVIKGSSADGAGIKPGDMIKRIHSQPVDDIFKSGRFPDYRANDKVIVTVLRNDVEFEVEVIAKEPWFGIRLETVLPLVSVVAERSGAARAGMLKGDLIVQVADKPIKTFAGLVEALSRYQVGDNVAVRIDRDDEEITMDITLGARGDVIMADDSVNFRQMSGELSDVRDGFPMVFQHDAVVPPRLCGGPVVNTDGKMVGINIARADRIATFGIAYQDLKALVHDLQSKE